MPDLKIENLCKSFDATVVLDDFNIELDGGTLLVVLGPSGCGKSTLLRLISGLETVDRGKIFLDGIDITSTEPQKRKTALVFQNYALYPHMTVFENLAFPLKVAHTNKREIKTIVQETAELLELESMLDKRPAHLSGGQRQRVALGRGLVRKPSIFLLDEPLSNLDASLRQKMRGEIVALQKRLGITMIYVTHDQIEALTMADQLLVLNDGRICQSGRPTEIYNDPQELFVASFIGTPPINIFEDTISGGRMKSLSLSLGSEVEDGRYMVGIRPEYIKVGEGDLSGEVVSSEYIGAVSHLKVRVGEIVLTMVCDGDCAAAPGSVSPYFNIPPDKIYLFDIASGRRVV